MKLNKSYRENKGKIRALEKQLERAAKQVQAHPTDENQRAYHQIREQAKQYGINPQKYDNLINSRQI
ncbi:MAG: hypothetical protein ACP5D2_00715 [Candidatus Nanoarchaeia archaeon]